MMDALEAGAEDIKTEGSVFEVYTSPDDFSTVNETRSPLGYNSCLPRLRWCPELCQAHLPYDIKNFEKMLDLMEDNDDVQNVWHNWDEE